MEIELDPADPTPLYLQIAGRIRRLIALGALRTGERLPTVRELAVRGRVNRNTAARAIQQLEREGIVRTRVGQGTFVADDSGAVDEVARDAELDDRLDRLIEEAVRLGVAVENLPNRLVARVEAFRRARRDERRGP